MCLQSLSSKPASREELEQVYGHKHARLGILEGDVAEGELEAGQSSGLIHDVVPAAVVVRRFVEEYEQRLAAIAAPEGTAAP